MTPLTESELSELYDILIKGELFDRRRALLSGMSPYDVASLPLTRSDRPGDQLRLDLKELNGRRPSATGNPFLTYLENARNRTLDLEGQQRIQGYLERVAAFEWKRAPAPRRRWPIGQDFVSVDRSAQWDHLDQLVRQPGGVAVAVIGPESECHDAFVKRLEREFPGGAAEVLRVEWSPRGMVPVDEQDYLASLAEALGLSPGQSPVPVLADRSTRRVLVHPLVDAFADFELLGRLEHYYKHILADLLAQVPALREVPGPVFVQPVQWPDGTTREWEVRILHALDRFQRSIDDDHWRFRLLEKLTPITATHVLQFLSSRLTLRESEAVSSKITGYNDSRQILKFLSTLEELHR